MLLIQKIVLTLWQLNVAKMGNTRYPIGIQTFSNIIEGQYIYIDKTKYVYELAKDYKYIFLSRPRRFGKSLLTSTFESYFEGKKDLFKGLEIDNLEKDWTEYPVLHFDMSVAKYKKEEELHSALSYQLANLENKFGVEKNADDENLRLTNIINSCYTKYGKKVVVLIDEYDAPLLDVLDDAEQLKTLRQIMRNFYSPLKACDQYLRFVFLTGITKFSQLSIFSELNNLKNISMMPEYAAICGISEEEITSQLSEPISEFAKENGITNEEVRQILKENYDGYHFTWPSSDIYNPFSLLQALQDKSINPYWFGSGTPTFLIKELRKFKIDVENIDNNRALSSAFDAPTETMTSILPLLYQSGYITIEDYDKILRLYTLRIPNKEVRIGLMESLLPNYVKPQRKDETMTTVAYMYDAIRHDDLDKALTLIQTFLGTIPYTDNTDYEGHYQSLFYVIFSLLGMYVDVEVRTPKGRVDMVMKANGRLYIWELKIDKSADGAMTQIDLKQYHERFVMENLPITKVGINFSSKTRNITDWKIMDI